jgi:hypothetical protein
MGLRLTMGNNAMPARVLLLALAAAVLVSLSAPLVTKAADGEVVSRGTNVCTNVTKFSSNAAGFTCQNLGDCPIGVDGCWVEIKYQTQCEWVWCTSYDDRTGWIRLGVGQDTHSYCVHGKQKWQVRMRIAWADANVTTVETWAEPELVLNAGGSYVNRNMAKFEFNASANTGMRRGVRIATQTGTSANAGEAIIASSGGTFITLSC